jgi:drug/metabolite transporter (DMT)-like permease
VNLGFNVGDLWILGAVAGTSIYTVLLKKAKIEPPPVPLLVLVLGIAALSLAPFCFWEFFHDPRIAVDWHDIVVLAYVGIIGGGLMFLLYNSGVEVLGAAEASVTVYLQAFFTAILAYLLLGEKLHLYHVAGITLIASGIVIVMLFKQKLPARSAAPGVMKDKAVEGTRVD